MTRWQAATGALLMALAACSGRDDDTAARTAWLGSGQGGQTYGSGSGSGSDAGAGSGSDAGAGSGSDAGAGSGSDAGLDGGAPDGAVDGGPDGGPSDGAIDGAPGDGMRDGGTGDGGAGDGGAGDGGAGDGGAGDGGAGDGGAGDGGAGDGGTDGGTDGGASDGGTSDGGPPGPPPPDAGGPGPGPGSGRDPDDICTQLANGDVDDSEVSQQTLDLCNGNDPPQSTCQFFMVPAFYLGYQGCNVYDDENGADLGNYSVTCPSDPYEQDSLCKFARQAWGPPRWQPGGDPWIPCWDEPCDGSGGFSAAAAAPMAAPPAQTFFAFNTFSYASPPRAAVVLGSSMMSTHFQSRNGLKCGASTTADTRGMRGNNIWASPAWRASWSLGLALARTGYGSADVVAQPGADTCGHAWNGPAPPAASGVQWLNAQGGIDKVMFTDGGLINDLRSRAGGWPDTLTALVACNAMQALEGPVNTFLDEEHYILNGRKDTVKVDGRSVRREPMHVKFVRQMRNGGTWSEALDVQPGQEEGRCWYEVILGNGKNEPASETILTQVEMRVPPLLPLAGAVTRNLSAIRDEYKNVGVKQVWLQYPYMEQARVTLRGTDLKLLWPVVTHLLHERWNAAVSIPAVDDGLQLRMRKVSDDLNAAMFGAIGCANFMATHAAQVCARDAAGKPLVVVTQSNYPGWGPADHQSTIVGGMPHESTAGADKLGAALNAADQLR